MLDYIILLQISSIWFKWTWITLVGMNCSQVKLIICLIRLNQLGLIMYHVNIYRLNLKSIYAYIKMTGITGIHINMLQISSIYDNSQEHRA